MTDKTEIIIPVSDQWRIRLDNYCWELQKWRDNQKNPEKSGWRGTKWFRTLEQACHRLLRDMVLDTQATTLPEWQEAHEQALTAILKGIQHSCLENSWLDMKKKVEIHDKNRSDSHTASH